VIFQLFLRVSALEVFNDESGRDEIPEVGDRLETYLPVRDSLGIAD